MKTRMLHLKLCRFPILQDTFSRGVIDISIIKFPMDTFKTIMHALCQELMPLITKRKTLSSHF